MSRLRVYIPSATAPDQRDIALEALDVSLALTILDINVGRGGGEIWDGERRLGEVIKHGGPHATFWEIAPG